MQKRIVCMSLVALSTLSLLSLTSCEKDGRHNTSHPDKGAVVVQMDWSDLIPETVTGSYVLNVDGHEQTVSGDVNAMERLAEPGEHTLLVYNRPESITLDGYIASVDEEVSSRTEGTGISIKPLPDYLFSLCETIRVAADDTLRITSKPRQWVRQVNVELSVAKGDNECLASVTGTLFGVERSVNIRKEERMGTAVQISNAFTIESGKCRTSFRLMGIVPAQRQILTVYITFTNGHTQTIESDLTEQMAGFHEGNTPLTLTADLRLSVEAGATGSISDWTVVDNGNIGIH